MKMTKEIRQSAQKAYDALETIERDIARYIWNGLIQMDGPMPDQVIEGLRNMPGPLQAIYQARIMISDLLNTADFSADFFIQQGTLELYKLMTTRYHLGDHSSINTDFMNCINRFGFLVIVLGRNKRKGH